MDYKYYYPVAFKCFWMQRNTLFIDTLFMYFYLSIFVCEGLNGFSFREKV